GHGWWLVLVSTFIFQPCPGIRNPAGRTRERRLAIRMILQADELFRLTFANCAEFPHFGSIRIERIAPKLSS
ncbi:MAG: hypothetical protein KDM81_14320, partial [Verrucomicrobiae bacterium]|nr:hypothetical protein [Verrucomicrobiae bacterium]